MHDRERTLTKTRFPDLGPAVHINFILLIHAAIAMYRNFRPSKRIPELRISLEYHLPTIRFSVLSTKNNRIERNDDNDHHVDSNTGDEARDISR